MPGYIVGTGAALPARIVPNAEIATLLGVTPEWIESNSGIRERRWATPEESTSTFAIAAVREALADAGAQADAIDYLIAGTLSPDYQVPGISPLVQRRLQGCRAIPALDVRAGCAAILYSLQIASSLIASGTASTVAAVGAEVQSKGLDLRPAAAELSMLFGDGAGALVVRREPRPGALEILDVLIETDGRFAEDLIVRAPGTANGSTWLDADHAAAGLTRGAMNGRNVILHAVRKLEEATRCILERNGVPLECVSTVIPHQANANLLRALARKLALPEDRIVLNVDRYGNTSGASAFLALSQARREGRIPPASYALIVAFGAGFTWGAALCRAAEMDA